MSYLYVYVLKDLLHRLLVGGLRKQRCFVLTTTSAGSRERNIFPYSKFPSIVMRQCYSYLSSTSDWLNHISPTVQQLENNASALWLNTFILTFFPPFMSTNLLAISTPFES